MLERASANEERPLRTDCSTWSATESCLPLPLGCKREGFSQTYLLSLSNTKLNLLAFVSLIGKSDRYLTSWQASLLNPLGCCILVNAVLDAIPTYIMSALHLPQGIIDSFDARHHAFLWSGEDTTSGAMCLVAWERCCQSKPHGGLGVKSLLLQNQCLLLKLFHRIHSSGDSSWARWIRDRIDVVTMEGDVHGCHRSSLKALLPAYRAATRVEVRNGRTTSFRDDVWLPAGCLAEAFPALHSHSKDTQVSVHDIVEFGLQTNLVPRLTEAATQELNEIEPVIESVQLQPGVNIRIIPFIDTTGKFLSTPIYNAAITSNSTPCPYYKFV